MPHVETVGFASTLHDTAMQRASQARSLQSWLATYELSVSKAFTTPLAVHTVPDMSLRAQKRISKVVAKVPAASLWLLVLANMSFAVFAIAVASIALKAANTGDVHQVYARLGIPGLVAALFEKNAGERVVEDDSELFQENDDGGKSLVEVGVQRIAPGGVAWAVRERQPFVNQNS